MILSNEVRAWFAVIGAISAVFMAVMDVQVANVVIEPIQTDLNSPVERASWLSSAYLIAEIIALPLAGLFLSWLGTRRFALVFVSLFLVGSILCATALTFPWMIAARSLQGFAGGAIMALSYVLIIKELPSEKRAQAITYFGAIVALAPVIGPIMAGYLTEAFGWRSIFYINVPIGLTALAIMLCGLKRAVSPEEGKLRSPDWVGILTVVPGLAALQFVLEEGYGLGWFESPLIAIASVLALVLLVLFIRCELSHRAPLVDLTLLANSKFLMAAGSSALVGAAIYGGFFLVPFFLIESAGLPPTEIALYFVFMCVGNLALLPFITKLTHRVHASLLIACGFILMALSTGLWTWAAAGAPVAAAFAAQIIRGLASPLILNPLGVMATTSVEQEDAASASILFNVCRSLGGAFGLALLRNLAAWRLEEQPASKAFFDTFGLMTIVLVLMSLAYFAHFALRRPKERYISETN